LSGYYVWFGSPCGDRYILRERGVAYGPDRQVRELYMRKLGATDGRGGW
jgi:hypothetical protein